MEFKEVSTSTFNKWKPPRSRYMERFKDRAWRMFGIKVPHHLRPHIRSRFEARKAEWTRRRIGGLIGATLKAHAPLFIENITQDFILSDILGAKPLTPSVFRFKNDMPESRKCLLRSFARKLKGILTNGIS